jgi:hypothetical protein
MMFPIPSSESARLALDTINQIPTHGIPSWLLNVMQQAYIERLAGFQPGDYANDPDSVYLAFQRSIGTCLLDQWIPRNPLTIGDIGFEEHTTTKNNATTGAEQILCDGMLISSPESVVEHMERFVFPALHSAIAGFDESRRVREIITGEIAIQALLGPAILKSGYDFVSFPILAYYTYGYANYFQAYALYPDVIETHFSLQADLALLNALMWKGACRPCIDSTTIWLIRVGCWCDLKRLTGYGSHTFHVVWNRCLTRVYV